MRQQVVKIRQLLKENDIDVTLVNSPENIYYLSGLTPNQLTVSRNPNFAGLIIKDHSDKMILTTMDYENATFENLNDEIILDSYTTWVGLKNKEEVENELDPSYDFKSSLDIIQDHLSDYEDKGKYNLGIELDFITASYIEEIKKRFPHANLINISDIFIKARSVKTDEEVEMFRNMVEVQDKALLEMSKHVKVGVKEKDLLDVYKSSIFEDGRFLPSGWTMIGFGENSSRLSRPTDKILENHHSIRFDGGVNADFDFYTTDFSRSWLMPDADPLLVEIKDILYQAQQNMIKSIKVGMKFSDLFNLGFNQVRESIPNYTRGHLGHSISLGPQTAEYPVINKDNHDTIKENMILCVEVPLYISGFGGFNIEDMVLVTKDGAEVLSHRSPHYLEFEKRK